MIAADAYPGFSTDINATLKVLSPLPSRSWLLLGFVGGLVPALLLPSSLELSGNGAVWHELSGYCD